MRGARRWSGGVSGAMRGPSSFEAAGELSDGCHHALSHTREAYDYAVRHIRAGAERAGRDLPEVADPAARLRLVHERITPELC